VFDRDLLSTPQAVLIPHFIQTLRAVADDILSELLGGRL
jgi:hypothetical protein